MRRKRVSITLAPNVLTGVDRLARSKRSRSAFIERVLRLYLKRHAEVEVEARDHQRLNAAADRLNSEAQDVLEFTK